MSVEIIKELNIDFYNKKYIVVDTKQYDMSSRFILITCYNQGILFLLSNTTNSAYIRYKKADGYGVFNQCTITDEGKILIELTEQMLAVHGNCSADIVVTDNTLDMNDNISTVSAEEIIQLNNSSIISTMNFCINVIPTPLDNSEIESSYEFNALNDLLIEASKDYEYLSNTVTAQTEEYAAIAKSYAIGDTNTRDEETTDNAKYYYEQSKQIGEGLNDTLLSVGTKANQSELDTHIENKDIHINNAERNAWNNIPLYTLGKSGSDITLNGSDGSISVVSVSSTDTDTHYTSKNVVGISTSTSNTTTALTNGNVYLNSVENGVITSAHKISGSGSTTITTDTSGNIVVSSTDTDTTYTGTSPITVSGNTITHSTNVTAGNTSYTNTIYGGTTMSLPYITYNAYGHITGKSTSSITLRNPIVWSGWATSIDSLSVNSSFQKNSAIAFLAHARGSYVNSSLTIVTYQLSFIFKLIWAIEIASTTSGVSSSDYYGTLGSTQYIYASNKINGTGSEYSAVLTVGHSTGGGLVLTLGSRTNEYIYLDSLQVID